MTLLKTENTHFHTKYISRKHLQLNLICMMHVFFSSRIMTSAVSLHERPSGAFQLSHSGELSILKHLRFWEYMSQLSALGRKQTHNISPTDGIPATSSDHGGIIRSNHIDYAQRIRCYDEDIPHIYSWRMPCEVSFQRSYLTCYNDQILKQAGQ